MPPTIDQEAIIHCLRKLVDVLQGTRLPRDIDTPAVTGGYITVRLVNGQQLITCLRCGRTSSNENDVRAKYCDACHVFHGQLELQETAERLTRERDAARDALRKLRESLVAVPEALEAEGYPTAADDIRAALAAVPSRNIDLAQVAKLTRERDAARDALRDAQKWIGRNGTCSCAAPQTACAFCRVHDSIEAALAAETEEQ